MKLHVVEQYSQEGVLEFVTIVQVDGCLEHNHTLEYSDELKRNQKLMEIAGREVSNGYQYAAVVNNS